MYKQYYNEYFAKCLQELKSTKNPQIQNQLKKFKKDFKDENFDKMISPFVSVLINDIIPYVEEEDLEDVMVDEFAEFMKATKFIGKSYVLDIRLKGQEQNCWRTLQIPATLTLSQLCYAIMSIFHCDGSHLFSMEYKNNNYYCDAYDPDFYDEETQYASECILPEFNLRKGSHMIMTYDFGDDFMFDIVVKEVKKYSHRLSLNDIQVLDGQGYGIWEDNHYMMDIYYDDPKAFYEVIEENGYDEYDFPIEEEFDLELLNEGIIEDMNDFIEYYENEESFINRF